MSAIVSLIDLTLLDLELLVVVLSSPVIRQFAPLLSLRKELIRELANYIPVNLLVVIRNSRYMGKLRV